jgi:ankyrin repeat protein
MAVFLLRNGADVEAATVDGWTPLMFAARSGNADMTQLLLANKSDVNRRNKNGQTPLYFAVENDRTATIDLLIKSGAKKLDSPMPRGTVK